MFMKTNRLALVALAGLVAPLSWAAPLTETAAVHLRPDASSPAVAVLRPGTEPSFAPAGSNTVPAGWSTVEVAGPHDVYVQNKEITKSLEVRPGAELRLQPRADAAVVATAVKDDALEITGLQGRWTQLRLNRPLVGYIKTPSRIPANAVAAPLPLASAPAGVRPSANAQPPVPAMAPAPTTPAAYGTGGAGQPAPMVNLGDGGASVLPRMFQGRFVSTRNPLRPRRPYDYALTDESGSRFAYVDVSRLLQTEQIDKYIDHVVAVFGAAKPIEGTKDFVIVAESFQLRK